MIKIKPLVWTEHMNSTLFRARINNYICYCIIKVNDNEYSPSIVLNGYDIKGQKNTHPLYKTLNGAKNYCKKWHIEFVTEMLE